MTPRNRTPPAAAPLGTAPAARPSLLRDLPVIVAGLALFYGLLSLTRYWTGPVNTQPEIDLTPGALPKYALFSVARIGGGVPHQPGCSRWSTDTSRRTTPGPSGS